MGAAALGAAAAASWGWLAEEEQEDEEFAVATALAGVSLVHAAWTGGWLSEDGVMLTTAQ